MGTGGALPELKLVHGMTLTTHSHLVPRSRMSFTPFPISTYMVVVGQLYFFQFTVRELHNLRDGFLQQSFQT
jgi:hypothetical protein